MINILSFIVIVVSTLGLICDSISKTGWEDLFKNTFNWQMHVLYVGINIEFVESVKKLAKKIHHHITMAWHLTKSFN